MTHYLIVRIDTQLGVSTQKLVEEVASNLESARGECGIISGVVAEWDAKTAPTIDTSGIRTILATF